MNYLLHILIMINIYLILALSLNLLVGYSGLLSLSHAAFYGIGAYVSALAIVKCDMGYLPAFALAVGGAGLLSFIISIPSLRLRGDFFVLTSLGFQIIIFAVLYNLTDLTGGPYGVSGIPRPKIAGITINSIFNYFLFSSLISAICLGMLYLIGNSPFGRVLKAIREDEMATVTLGKHVSRFKVKAFAIAAGFAAVSGVLFAGYMQFVDPTSFSMMESVFILSIIIIGGTGNVTGPLIGTVFMILLPEVLRLLGIPDAVAPNLRQIIYGALIILIMRYKPQGFYGEYRFE